MAPGAEILRQLIREYGPALHLPTGDNLVAAHIADQTHLAKGTILSILNGNTARINKNTRTKLASFFNTVAEPKIQSTWLSSNSLGEFNSKRAYSGSIPLPIPPDYHKKLKTIEQWICGVHVVYRYSLDPIDTGHVAREVIYVWNNGSFLEFSMSFINQVGGVDAPVFFFRGPVLLVGRSIALIGTNIGPANTAEREHDRVRVIVIDHDNGGDDTYHCKIGLMTTTRPRRDHAPCTASVIFIRVQWEAVFDDLAKSATVIQPLDEIINNDFGVKHAALIKLFLDNRPRGYKLESEIGQYDAPLGGDPERVLRLDTERFATYIRRMLADVISDDAIRVPFKKNWHS
jgi:hypothetical protein